ncbi:putative nucleoporin p58/p45 [Apostichopus japonicus]|uniref:Putative nucleoporin p58/p45 n=1 Tax=Stichopus japonicus TaxID=307972 RepID=A0A2G8LLD1_STIJA|nr:putative nucleoporin p58/p45 [Apostichopus japonicus]
MAAPFGGFNFGSGTATTSSATPGGFSFGSSGANKPTGFASATPAQSLNKGFSLGSATTQSTGLFGSTQPQATSLGGGLSFGSAGATTGAAKPTVSFGTPATTAGSTGFQLGGLKTTQASGGLSFGSTAKPGTSTQAGLTFGTSTTGSTFGATTQPGLSFGTTQEQRFQTRFVRIHDSHWILWLWFVGWILSWGRFEPWIYNCSISDSKVLQDSQVPAEICNTVTAFKDYVKRQKSFKDDIASFSDKPLHAVREDTVALKQLLAVLDSTFNRNAAAIHRLKEESSQTLKDAEIAQRTKEIPLGLQGENYAPSEYFQRLVKEFEDQFQQYRHLIEQLEHQMSAMSQKASYTPQELSQVMVKLNETFIALAAQLQGVHDLVKVQKEQYLTYRRVFHNESKDVFAARKKAVADQRRIKSAPTGSRAFEGTSNAAALAMLAALNGQPNTTGVRGPMNTGVGFGGQSAPTAGLSFGGGTTGFGTSALGGNTGTALGGGFGSGFTGSSFAPDELVRKATHDVDEWL